MAKCLAKIDVKTIEDKEFKFGFDDLVRLAVESIYGVFQGILEVLEEKRQKGIDKKRQDLE